MTGEDIVGSGVVRDVEGGEVGSWEVVKLNCSLAWSRMLALDRIESNYTTDYHWGGFLGRRSHVGITSDYVEEEEDWQEDNSDNVPTRDFDVEEGLGCTYLS